LREPVYGDPFEICILLLSDEENDNDLGGVLPMHLASPIVSPVGSELDDDDNNNAALDHMQLSSGTYSSDDDSNNDNAIDSDSSDVNIDVNLDAALSPEELDLIIEVEHGMQPFDLELLARARDMPAFTSLLCDATKRLSFAQSCFEETDHITTVLRPDIDAVILRTLNPHLLVGEQLNSLFAWMTSDPLVRFHQVVVRGGKLSDGVTLNGLTLTAQLAYGANSNWMELVVKIKSKKSLPILRDLHQYLYTGHFISDVFIRMQRLDRGFAYHLASIMTSAWYRVFNPTLWVYAVREVLTFWLCHRVARENDNNNEGGNRPATLDDHFEFISSQTQPVNGGSRVRCAYTNATFALALAVGGSEHIESRYTSVVVDFAVTETKRTHDPEVDFALAGVDPEGEEWQHHLLNPDADTQPFLVVTEAFVDNHLNKPVYHDCPDMTFACLPTFGGALDPLVVNDRTIPNPARVSELYRTMQTEESRYFGYLGSLDQISGSHFHEGHCSQLANDLVDGIVRDLEHHHARINNLAVGRVGAIVENDKTYSSTYHLMSAGNIHDALGVFKNHGWVGGFCLPYNLVTPSVVAKIRAQFGLAETADGLVQQMDVEYLLNQRPVGVLDNYIPAIQRAVSRYELALKGSTTYRETPLNNLDQHHLDRRGVAPAAPLGRGGGGGAPPAGRGRGGGGGRAPPPLPPFPVPVAARGGHGELGPDIAFAPPSPSPSPPPPPPPPPRSAAFDVDTIPVLPSLQQLDEMEFDQHSLEPRGARHEIRIAFAPGSFDSPTDLERAFEGFHSRLTARHRAVFAIDLIRYIHLVSHFVSAFVQSFAARFVYTFEYDNPEVLRTTQPVLISVVLAMIRLMDEYAYFMMGAVAPHHPDFWVSNYTLSTDFLEQMRLSGRPFSDFFDWCPLLTGDESNLWAQLPALDFTRVTSCPLLTSPRSHHLCDLYTYAKLFLDNAHLPANQHNVQLGVLQNVYDEFLVQDMGATRLLFDRTTTTLESRPPRRVVVGPEHPRNNPEVARHFIFADEIRERFYALGNPEDPPPSAEEFMDLALSCLQLLGQEYCDHFSGTTKSPKGGRPLDPNFVTRFTHVFQTELNQDPLNYFSSDVWKLRLMSEGAGGKYHQPRGVSFNDIICRICFDSHPDSYHHWRNSKLRAHLLRCQNRFQLTGHNDPRFLDGLTAARHLLFGDHPVVIHRISKPKKIERLGAFWIFHI
jgi:hypothetical protein